MDYRPNTEFESNKSGDDVLSITVSSQLSSALSKNTHNKDTEINASHFVSHSENTSENSDMFQRRRDKSFSPHANHHLPSSSKIKATGNGSHSQSDTEIYTGNLACRSSPCTQMESFMSSPSTSNISSDVDSTPSSNKPDDLRKLVSKENCLELKEPLSLLTNSINFPPPPPPLQSGIPNSFARFQLDNRIDGRLNISDKFFSNHSDSIDSDTNTSNKRTNLTFSVENILAPNKFGHNGIRDSANEESKEHTDDDEEQGRQ